MKSPSCSEGIDSSPAALAKLFMERFGIKNNTEAPPAPTAIDNTTSSISDQARKAVSLPAVIPDYPHFDEYDPYKRTWERPVELRAQKSRLSRYLEQDDFSKPLPNLTMRLNTGESLALEENDKVVAVLTREAASTAFNSHGYYHLYDRKNAAGQVEFYRDALNIDSGITPFSNGRLREEYGLVPSAPVFKLVYNQISFFYDAKGNRIFPSPYWPVEQEVVTADSGTAETVEANKDCLERPSLIREGGGFRLKLEVQKLLKWLKNLTKQ